MTNAESKSELIIIIVVIVIMAISCFLAAGDPDIMDGIIKMVNK